MKEDIAGAFNKKSGQSPIPDCNLYYPAVIANNTPKDPLAYKTTGRVERTPKEKRHNLKRS